MPEQINKVRFLIMGKEAPKGSGFKGVVTAKSIFGGGGLFEYNSREAKKSGENEANNENSYFAYTNRYTKDSKNFTMTSDGILDSEEKSIEFRKKGLKSLEKDNTIVWEFFFSLKDVVTAEKYGLANQSEFSTVIAKIMPGFLRSCGFNENNVTWWQDYHPTNRKSIEPHPHIHLCFYEDDQERTKGKLSIKDLNRFKKLMATEMIKRSDDVKYRNLMDNININIKSLVDFSKKMDLTRVDSVLDLYNVLPNTGRLQYESYNMLNYKSTIDNITTELLNSKECKEAWDSLNEKLDEYETMMNKVTGSVICTRKTDEIHKLYKDIGNYILSQKKEFDGIKKEKDEIRAKSKADEYTLKASPKKPTRGNYTNKTKRFINYRLKQRQDEIQREIDEYFKNLMRGYYNSL